MYLNNHETHLLITESVSKIPELQNPIELLTEIKHREEEFCKIQNEIKTLYDDCQKDGLSSYNKDLAKDMIANITDGRFEEFYKSKPTFLKIVDANIQETIKHVEIVKNELKNMKCKPAAGESCDLLLKMLAEQSKLKSGVADGDILAKCVNGFEKFKSNFENLQVSEELVKNSKRDVLLEENMKKIIVNVKGFQQVMDARKSISSLSRLQQKTPEVEDCLVKDSHHSHLISNLLKDVERLNYFEPDE